MTRAQEIERAASRALAVLTIIGERVDFNLTQMVAEMVERSRDEIGRALALAPVAVEAVADFTLSHDLLDALAETVRTQFVRNFHGFNAKEDSIVQRAEWSVQPVLDAAKALAKDAVETFAWRAAGCPKRAAPVEPTR